MSWEAGWLEFEKKKCLKPKKAVKFVEPKNAKRTEGRKGKFSHKKMSIVSAEKCVFDKPFNISVSPWTIVNAMYK